MKRTTLGMLIRKFRLEHDYSQEGICNGICTVSYLSKIENGLVIPGDDILQALFQKIGMHLETDTEYLLQIKNQLEAYFTHFFEAFECEPPAEAAYLREQYPRYTMSELFIDGELFCLYDNHLGDPEKQRQLGEFLNYMDTTQRFRFYLAQASSPSPEAYLLEAYHLIPSCISNFSLAFYYTSSGQTHKAILHAMQTYQQASEQGNLIFMIKASFLLGTCYSNENQLELMIKYYQQANNLAGNFIPSVQCDSDYNIGATLIGCRQFEEGYHYLLKAENPRMNLPLLYHKLAIAAYELKRPEEGRRHLAAAWNSLEDNPNPVYEMFLRAVQLHYEEKEPGEEYLLLLERIYETLKKDFPVGFQRFYGSYLIEAYSQKRKYKEALRVSMEMQNTFFLNQLKIPL